METGILYIVATPIGNLGDITLRALDTLKGADIIAAEDTRRTQKLLNHYDIKARMLSFHEHSGAARLDAIINELLAGKTVALVSDAGTPLISDPGYVLVRECLRSGIRVESLPGPCAMVTALTLSGLDCSSFAFYGFLNTKASARKNELARIAAAHMTAVIYEGASRVVKTLGDICEVMGGDANVSIARELTKLHEEIVRLPARQAVDYFAKEGLKGEFVIVIEAAKADAEPSDSDLVADLKARLESGLTKKEAVTAVTALRGCPKNRVYKLLIDNFE